jgi:hypothetical protein
MRAFTVDVAAAALGVDRKYLDNLLARHRPAEPNRDGAPRAHPAAAPGRQGIRRRLTHGLVLQLAVVIALAHELDVPLAAALRLATALGAEGRVVRGPLTITVDRVALDRALARRLAIAMEGAREPKRGRPPRAPRRDA